MKIFSCQNKQDFKNFIAAGGDVNETNSKKQNILFYINDADLCDFLIKAGADVNCVDSKGENPLFGASVSKMQVLIKNGINVNQVNDRFENALFYVRKPKEARLLLSTNININQRNRFKRNVLFNTNMADELFEIFLTNGIDVNVIDSEGSPLIFFLDLTLMKKIEKYKTDVDWHLQHKKSGENALFKYFNYDELKFLLSKGVNPNVVNKTNLSPFFFNLYFLEKTENLNLLQEFNADLTILNKSKMNFITNMIKYSRDCSYEWLKEAFLILPEIKERNLLNQIDYNGDTIANDIKVKNYDLLQILVDNGLDINFVNSEGEDIFTKNFTKTNILVKCGYTFSESALNLLSSQGCANEKYINNLKLFLEVASPQLKSKLVKIFDNKSKQETEKIVGVISEYEKKEIAKKISSDSEKTVSIKKRI